MYALDFEPTILFAVAEPECDEQVRTHLRKVLRKLAALLADATLQAGPASLQEGALRNIELFFGWVSDVGAFEAALKPAARLAAE